MTTLSSRDHPTMTTDLNQGTVLVHRLSEADLARYEADLARSLAKNQGAVGRPPTFFAHDGGPGTATRPWWATREHGDGPGSTTGPGSSGKEVVTKPTTQEHGDGPGSTTGPGSSGRGAVTKPATQEHGDGPGSTTGPGAR